MAAPPAAGALLGLRDWRERQAASRRRGIAAHGCMDGVLVPLVDRTFVGAARCGSVAVRAIHNDVPGTRCTGAVEALLASIVALEQTGEWLVGRA